MYRDAGCGCCLEWADHAAAGLDAKVTAENADMAMVKDLHGVPGNLRSCHTMIVEGYVIEGHVPAEAIRKLLREKPDNVIGLAAADGSLCSLSLRASVAKTLDGCAHAAPKSNLSARRA